MHILMVNKRVLSWWTQAYFDGEQTRTFLVNTGIFSWWTQKYFPGEQTRIFLVNIDNKRIDWLSHEDTEGRLETNYTILYIET